MPASERLWRVLEWVEGKEAEAEAARQAREERTEGAARRQLEAGFNRGLGAS